MNDDLNVPAALAVVHGAVRRGNEALADGATPRMERSPQRGMLDVLGLDPFDPQWARGSGVDDRPRRRRPAGRRGAGAAAGRRARRDYAAADAIRAQLGEAGIAVEDTSAGPRWTLKDPEDRA